MRDIKTQLIINTLTREKYNELCANEQIEYEQLYLVEDTVLDAFNKRVVNVSTPISADDAVTKDYVETNFIKTTDIRSHIDNSKLYSINANEYPYGTVYVDGKMKVFEKQSNPKWIITVNAGDVQPEDVTLTWTGQTFGWRFDFNGKSYYGTNKTEIADESRVINDGYDILAERIWPQIDSYVSKKEIYNCLSDINSSSSIELITSSLMKLNSILSTFNT